MKEHLAAVAAKQFERQNTERMRDAAEFLWVVLANVSEGNWNKQSEEWRGAAERARDDFHALCKTLNMRAS